VCGCTRECQIWMMDKGQNRNPLTVIRLSFLVLNNIEAMLHPMTVAKYTCRYSIQMCVCFLKSGTNHWFWRQKRLGHIRVEFLNIFSELEHIEGVSFDALESILLTINPWSIDDYLLQILTTMVSKVGSNQINVGVVNWLLSVPRGDRRLAYELFFSIVTKCNNIQEVHVVGNFFLEKDIKFIIEQTITNIPHLRVLWEPLFGTIRYHWLAKHYRYEESLAITFSNIILNTDWSESTVHVASFQTLLSLFKKKGVFSSERENCDLSFTSEEFITLVFSFTKETITSNWTCLYFLLDHAYVQRTDLSRNINEEKIRKIVNTLETVCKNCDTNSDEWKCAIEVMLIFTPSIKFFEEKIDLSLQIKFSNGDIKANQMLNLIENPPKKYESCG